MRNRKYYYKNNNLSIPKNRYNFNSVRDALIYRERPNNDIPDFKVFFDNLPHGKKGHWFGILQHEQRLIDLRH